MSMSFVVRKQMYRMRKLTELIWPVMTATPVLMLRSAIKVNSTNADIFASRVL